MRHPEWRFGILRQDSNEKDIFSRAKTPGHAEMARQWKHNECHVADAVCRAHNRYGRGNDFDYGTGLNRAIVKRAENLAEELLRRGARTDSKTMNIASRGETALELAAKYTPRLIPLVVERRKQEELISGRGVQ